MSATKKKKTNKKGKNNKAKQNNLNTSQKSNVQKNNNQNKPKEVKKDLDKENSTIKDEKISNEKIEENKVQNEVKTEEIKKETLDKNNSSNKNIPKSGKKKKKNTTQTSKEENKKEIKKEDSSEKKVEAEKEELKEEKKDLIKAPPKEVTKAEEKPEYVQEMIKKKKRKAHIILTIIVSAIFLITVSTIFAIFNLKNTNIIKGVSIKSIDVSNLSKEDTIKQLTEALNKELISEIKFKYGEEYNVTLKPEQIEFKYNIEEVVEEAYNVGRKGNILQNNYSILYTNIFGRKLKINYTYNGDLLNQFVEDMKSKLPGIVVEPTYYIEEGKLIVTKGTDGIQVKSEDLKNQIIQAILSRNVAEITDGFTQEIEIPTEDVKASPIDMIAIHKEIYCEPKDAYFELEPYKIYPDVDGIDFAISPEEAQNQIISEDKNEYTFDLKITGAEKTLDDLGTEAFPYLISEFSTKYDARNRNRSTNLEIAANKINGKVLMPGEEFSFNKIVAKRTVEEGYKDAAIYADGGVVDGLAGGICQISSTLYNAVLFANLQVTERRNHSFTTSYVAAGRDATVVWGTTDFRFINSRSYPIKIEATVKNGVAEFKIHGMQEETEYDVKILPVTTQYIPYATVYEEDPTVVPGQQIRRQAGHQGYKVTTYKELKLNGEVVSKEAISSDTYQPMRAIIRVAPGMVPPQ